MAGSRMPAVRFNKVKYRKNLVGLSNHDLREALIREAELRFNAETALLELRDYINKERTCVLEKVDMAFDGVRTRVNKHLTVGAKKA